MSKDWTGNWEDRVKEIKFTEREPLWKKAIKFLMVRDDTSPTMRLTLSQNDIHDIISSKDNISIYDMFLALVKWMKRSEIYFYLSAYFANGDEIWLAYLMDVYYDLKWNGEDWKSSS